MEFIGMKQVKELGTVQSVYRKFHYGEASLLGSLAIGFMSADFVIWDLINETKDQEIHIHKLWVAISEKQVLPQVLHMQFHGREIHTLSFVSLGTKLKQKGTPCALVATGCEDGTVRLTRFDVATLGQRTSPVLALQYIVVSGHGNGNCGLFF